MPDKKCHFASSSYISPDMKNLNDEAKRNNLVFINEVGLDPGIDHFFTFTRCTKRNWFKQP